MSLVLAMLLGGCARDPGAQLRYPRITNAILARVDLDHDGRVSQDEYTKLAFPDEPMDPWDADHDAALDPVEIETAFLAADPTRLQLEGRQAVYKKYGYPFGEPTVPLSELPSKAAPGDMKGDRSRKHRLRNRADR